MRLSALFELGDEQFSAVRSELETVEARYSSDVRGGNLNLPIDTSSLEAFIEENALIDEIVQEFEKGGYTMESPMDEGYQERYARDLRDLVTVLKFLDAETIADLDSMLKKLAADPATTENITSSFEGVFDTWRSPADLLTFFIGIPMNAPTEAFEPIYGKSITKAIRSLRGEPSA
jgi:hypothetical protein